MINIRQELEVAKRASEIAAALLIDNKDNINKYLDLKNVLCVGTSNFEEF